MRDIVIAARRGRRIGDVTDLRYTAASVDSLSQLLAGADRLYIEAAFLEADTQHAARKNHLTARQAGQIARAVGARRVLPFHFSPSYEDRAAELAAEVRAAWSGALWPARPAP